MQTRIKGLFLIGLALLLAWASPLRVTADDNSGSVLNNYIKTGLKNNLALKQHTLSLEKSLEALKEARGMFLPTINIEARYSRAGGGRQIDILVGDLVNPMHNTLNQLLMAHGMPGPYPANIPNEQIPFLRPEEHDTKLRIMQPVFQPGLFYNRKIKKELTGIEEAKVNAYKRQLVADIQTAYYNYLKTLQVLNLLKNTRKLLEENLHVSQSLFDNHKRTEEVVFRSKAELSSLGQQQAEAERDRQMAAAYFNFLLNRRLDDEIEVIPIPSLPTNVTVTKNLQQLEQQALEHREEFNQLYRASAAAGLAVKLHKSSILPNVTAVFDYGFQGEKYKFTGKDDYWMASLVMTWNLYKGGQDKSKQLQAAIEKKKLEMQRLELENEIRMQVKEAFHNFEAARAALQSAEDQVRSREEAFHIISKKYQQDMVPQIEYIKAQNDLTEAATKDIIARFELFIKKAALNRVSAEGYAISIQ